MVSKLINGITPIAINEFIEFLRKGHTAPVEICFSAFPESAGDSPKVRIVDLRENAIQLLVDAAKQTAKFSTSTPLPLPGFLNRFTLSPCC